MSNPTEELLEQRRKFAEHYPELRDTFAVSAIDVAFKMLHVEFENTFFISAKDIAIKAYEIADAMLSERQRRSDVPSVEERKKP